MNGFFVTGTGTDVGKTYVTAQIIIAMQKLGYRTGYYKAALSGALRVDESLVPGDAQYAKQAAKLSNEQVIVSHVYEPALSPHLASKLTHLPFSLEKVARDAAILGTYCDRIIAEGAGGIICPLSMDEEPILLEDVIRLLDLPLILVADAGLGTINATVLSTYYAKARHMPLAGIILNRFDEADIMHQDNKKVIEQLTGIKVIACIKEHGSITDVEAFAKQTCN